MTPPGTTVTLPVALTIAGSDSSGGAGIQADLKTFAAFRVYGASVLTALTAQNTRGVDSVAPVEPAFVAQQIAAVLDDLDVAAAKTGMVARPPVIDAIVDALHARPVPHLVVDPVMVASSGALLLESGGVERLRGRLLPLATLVTPNLREAEVLTGRSVSTPAEMADAARALVDLGARAALIKGGHLTVGRAGRLADEALDVFCDGRSVTEFSVARVPIPNTHGSGCTLSAAVVAGLALGRSIEAAIWAAKRYVTRAIEAAFPLGHGAIPLNHLVPAEGPNEKP